MGANLARGSVDVSRDQYAGVNIRHIRRLADSGWEAGIVIACLLMLPALPTARFGAWGWAAGIGVQALSAAGLFALRRHPECFGSTALLAVAWLLAVDLGIVQWLGGGWGARAEPRRRRFRRRAVVINRRQP